MNFKTENLFELKGKTVVLTGASGFLGRTMARAFLVNGARVVALGRSKRLKELSGEWQNEFGADSVEIHQLDMYDHAALRGTLKEIVKKESRVDVLVNNAHELGPATGFNTSEGVLENSSFDQWMKHLGGGLYWAVLGTQILGEKMKKQKSGSIINIGTVYALVAPSPRLYKGTKVVNPPGYSASKAALLAFTRYTASFWGEHGIRSNAICPGPFSNTEDVGGPNSVDKNDPFLQALSDRTALGRIGMPHELAGTLIFLASDASSYISGQAIFVDGGWTIT